MDELEDTVPPSVHAGNEVRPRHRTLRRNAGGQKTERSLLDQGGKVRHLALGHKSFQQLWVHAVNAKNDDLLLALPFARLTGNQKRCGSAHQQGEAKVPDWFKAQGKL